MKQQLKIWWHWFWYRLYLPLSVRSIHLHNSKVSRWHAFAFGEMYKHGLKLHEIDPVGLRRYADKLLADTFPIDDVDVE